MEDERATLLNAIGEKLQTEKLQNPQLEQTRLIQYTRVLRKQPVAELRLLLLLSPFMLALALEAATDMPQAAKDSSTPEDTRLYQRVTLWIVSHDVEGYILSYKPYATRNQLQKRWDQLSFNLVARVPDQPAHVLTLATCPEATSMEEVELDDDCHLAVVVQHPLARVDQLEIGLKATTQQATSSPSAHRSAQDMVRFKDNLVVEQEHEAQALCLAQIQHEPGATIFCTKILSHKDNGERREVELDGAAVSDDSVALAERKQTFSLAEVESFSNKADSFKWIVKHKAANTGRLQGKRVLLFFIAGGWGSDTDENAAIRELMTKNNIKPVMKNGNSLEVSWGCHPPRPKDARLAQAHLDKRERKAAPVELATALPVPVPRRLSTPVSARAAPQPAMLPLVACHVRVQGRMARAQPFPSGRAVVRH